MADNGIPHHQPDTYVVYTNEFHVNQSHIDTLLTVPNQAGNDGDAQVGENLGADTSTVESDSTLQLREVPRSILMNPRRHGADAKWLKVHPRDKSTAAPLDDGWKPVSEKLHLNNKEPLRKGSTVYKGRQKFAGGWRDVAIKLVPYSRKNLDEVKFLTMLEDHPNIIHIYESDEIHDGITPQIYIVMELCPQNLRDYVETNKKKPFDFEEAFSYAKQIVAGVAFIHKHNILHRDLKLENILLSSSMEYIRVADFGLSKELDVGRSVGTISSPGLGSDGYRAPEMHNDNPVASFYSDTFSLGVVLSSLFSNGHHPFGSNPYKWRSNIIDNKRPNFSDILQFGFPYDHKREQLIDLLKLTLRHNYRDRPKPCELQKHPFFSGIDKENSQGLLSKFASIFTTQTSRENKTQQGDDAHAKKNDKLVAKIKKLEDTLNDTPLSKLGFEKGALMVRELQGLRGSNTLTDCLQLAECELFLSRGKEQECFNAVKQTLGESSVQLKAIALSLAENNHPIRAMILYILLNDLAISEDPDIPDQVVQRISNDVVSIRQIIKPLLKDPGRFRKLALTYGVRQMTTLLGEVRSVTNASSSTRAANEAICLAQIASVNGEVGDAKAAITICEEGLQLLDEQLHDDKVNYKSYTWLLNNMGTAYYDSGKYTEAKQCFETCITANQLVGDYDNETERRDYFKLARRNLSRARVALGEKISENT